jgi:regulator of protease activity HflC (stomatin/prohibitin superfamily)
MSKRAILLGLAVIAVAAVVLITYLVLQREEQRLTIEQVKERHETELMAIEGVVGVGIGECEGEPCVKVLLKNESSDLKRQIPTQLDGYPVDTEVVGSLEALPE